MIARKALIPIFFAHVSPKVAEVGDGNITIEKEGTRRASFIGMHLVQSLRPRQKDYTLGLMLYCCHIEILKNF